MVKLSFYWVDWIGFGEREGERIIDSRADAGSDSAIGFMTLASGQFEREAVHGRKGLARVSEVITESGREGQEGTFNFQLSTFNFQQGTGQ